MDAMPVDTVPLLNSRKPPLWQRGIAWLKARHRQRQVQATAFEKHMKPTMRLLLLILCTSSLMSAAVVVFASIFVWNHSTTTVASHVLRDAELIAEGLNLFGYIYQTQTYDTNEERLASLVALVVENLGYQGTQSTMMQNLAYQQTMMGSLLDGWFERDCLTVVSSTAVISRSWIEQLLRVQSTDAVVAMINLQNPKMPVGHEMLVGQLVGGSIVYLTDFRYASQCLHGNCLNSAASMAPMVMALQGSTGTMFIDDYRPVRCATAYTPLAGTNYGLVYKVDLAVLQTDYIDPMTIVVNTINNQSNAVSNITNTSGTLANTQEVVLATTTNGQTNILSVVRSCDAKCMQSAKIEGSYLTLALDGVSGCNITTDFDGTTSIFEAYGPMPYSAMGLVIKMAVSEMVNNLYVSLGSALDVVNTQLPGTEEVQFAAAQAATAGSAPTLEIYTKYKYASGCTGPCGSLPNTSMYMWQAIDNGITGAMQAEDYRGVMVLAGYAPISSLSAALVMKIDQSQLISEGVIMAGTIASYQNDVRYVSKTTEVMVAKAKPGVTVVTGPEDVDQITVLKYGSQCPNSTCATVTPQMLSALNGQTGVTTANDYRGVSVIGAYTFTPGLGLGVVVKIDSVEANAPSLYLTLELCACTISAVALSMLALAFLANVLLKSMDRAWEEGKRAIEREKQQFRNVVEAMYPNAVAKRLLAGETQIVYTVASAAVFFSDIYEFTATSNCVTPDELIKFLGYTFGVMDRIADHFHVHKVKTIGDAYLAVGGLPGVDSPSGNVILDTLYFASACAQVFTFRFCHPPEGAALTRVAQTVLNKRAKLAKTDDIAAKATVATPPAHCVMRYGMAAGPITAGVLQGKTPLFDIWGKTVNLASRMESTGQPGRIQVSEAIYQATTQVKGQPFVFETRHKVFCKGFGNVTAYYVNGCSVSPPLELLATLDIEPSLGQFYFDNPIPGFKALMKNGPTAASSARDSTHEASSARSSDVSGNIRAEPALKH
eukprot:TRINITY_DN132_c0_g1_i1.p1 TRINITY_DN132_c0_g1~~TRINITY_DN132_c0_g1_i1.p1  ORF type:complete len:999 (-),score=276.51 TRINITY_DN132_c0_g1_i1:532-3528(-)